LLVPHCSAREFSSSSSSITDRQYRALAFC